MGRTCPRWVMVGGAIATVLDGCAATKDAAQVDAPSVHANASPAPSKPEDTNRGNGIVRNVAMTAQFAGFPFGIDVDNARQRCAQAGGAMQPDRSDADRLPMLICSVTPVQVEVPGLAVLTFCRGGLCEIIQSVVGKREYCAHAFALLADKLTAKYGRPMIDAKARSNPESACPGGPEAPWLIWIFAEGRSPTGRVSLKYSCGGEQDVVGLTYQNAEGLRRRLQEYDEKERNY
jgi:hypothetical protein